jgi:hypothetical protein
MHTVTEPTQIYLHIGVSKTGTSVLTEACDRSREQFARQGICYPRTPGLRNHILLTLYASDDPRTSHVLRKQVAVLASRGALGDAALVDPSEASSRSRQKRVVDLFDEEAYLTFRRSFPEQLRREIVQSGCQKVVLSNLQLSAEVKTVKEIRRLADLLRPISNDIRVVVYLRRQDERALSLYSTAIKSGDTYSGRKLEETNPNFNYALMLEPWAQVFGKEALVVRVYGQASLKDGNVVSDFFSLVGYEPDASARVPGRRNPRLDDLTLTFLAEFNRHVPRFLDSSVNPLRDNIGTALESISDGSKPNWPGEPLHQLVEKFAESNARVAREYLNIEDGKLFSDSPEDEPEHEPELSVDKAIEIAAKLWIWKQEELIRLRKRFERLQKKAARLERLQKESVRSLTGS